MVVIFSISTSNVVLGDYTIGENPDCSTQQSCLPPVQDILVERVKIHKNWNLRTVRLGFDIALVRLSKPAILSFVSIFTPLLVLFSLMGCLMTRFLLSTGRSLDCRLPEPGLMPQFIMMHFHRHQKYTCPWKVKRELVSDVSLVLGSHLLEQDH